MKKRLIFTVVVSLFCPLVLPGCNWLFAGTDAAPLHIAGPEKIVYEENLLETVIIDRQEYLVPSLWQGKKIDSSSVNPSLLVQVPSQFVENNGKIYLALEAADAFRQMAEGAELDDVHLVIDSGYRSVWYQKKVYRRKMEKGESFEEVARFVAPPGYSEHALGQAVDFSPSDWRFVDSPVYAWLREHASEYGFTETYPEGNPSGEPWEPSHWCFQPPSSDRYPDDFSLFAK